MKRHATSITTMSIQTLTLCMQATCKHAIVPLSLSCVIQLYYVVTMYGYYVVAVVGRSSMIQLFCDVAESALHQQLFSVLVFLSLECSCVMYS